MEILENIHNSLIFYPTKEVFASPAQDGIEHEEVFIKTADDENLHGYFFPANIKTKKTVIYLHGNAQNVSTWYIAPVEIQKHVPVNFLLVDYQGYGKSTGKPSVEGVITDAQAMYKYLIERGDKPEDISLYGRSIGGAIALELAIREKVKSVVVQSSFTSLKEIAKELFPFIPNQLVKNSLWNSQEIIKKINAPILISHGDQDEIVPVSHSYKLFEAANEPKKIIVLKGAAHNELSSYFTEEYFNTLQNMFLS